MEQTQAKKGEWFLFFQIHNSYKGYNYFLQLCLTFKASEEFLESVAYMNYEVAP